MTAKNQALVSPGLITNLDLSEYWGRSGSIIRIATRTGHRDFPVRVSIKDILGVLIEQGVAAWHEPSAKWRYKTKAQVPPGEIWILTVTAANPQEQTTREAICVPLTLRWPTEFKTAPWAHAAGLGRWLDN
jgi:hypothetical protein